MVYDTFFKTKTAVGNMDPLSKKIGCVVAYSKNQNNYGASLQSYATIKKIRELAMVTSSSTQSFSS